MASNSSQRSTTRLSADDAFAALGNETRLQILQALGETEEPLAYSDLYERVSYDDASNFNYHLDQLVEHFVRKTEDGYLLRLAGRRVVAAILSGVVTENPVVDRTPVEMPCMYCGNQLEMAYHDELVVLYCDACDVEIERAKAGTKHWPIPSTDIVGYVSLPPAGIYDRSPSEALDAAGINTIAGINSMARGVCPQCTATVTQTIDACTDHDSATDICAACGHQFGLTVDTECTNCIFRTGTPVPAYLLANKDLMSFMLEHGIDPISPTDSTSRPVRRISNPPTRHAPRTCSRPEAIR